MADLTVRTDNKPPKTSTNRGDWHPFRAMRELLNWDPFQGMEPLMMAEPRIFMPHFEVVENKDNFTFKADLPGVKESDIKISVTGNRLLIAGKRESKQEQKDATYYVCERSYGEFSRAFTLPDGADTEHVAASLNDGVLQLVVPKQPQAQTKQIPLQGSKSKD